MKKIILISSLVTSFLLSQYLQSGIYADCAHVMDEAESEALTAFRVVKVSGTVELSEQAAEIGVCCFVFKYH